MQLRVISRYENRDVVYEVGQTIDVDDMAAAWLMRDAPGCFEPVQDKPKTEPEPEAKAETEPPEDKAMRSPKRKRAKTSGK